MIENPARESIVRVLKRRKRQGASPRLIASRSRLPYQQVFEYLRYGMEKGRIERVRKGVYRLVKR